MKILPTKGRGYRMPFVLLLLLCAANHLWATPECPIVTSRFPWPNGTTVDNSATGWYLDASHVSGTGYFAVKSNRFHAEELGGEGIWYSRVFSTAGYTDWQVAVKVSSEGDMNSSEYVKIYYKINGGSEILLDQRTGNFGTIDFTSPTLNGNNVQLVVKIYNYNNGGSQTSKYYIEEYRVFKEKGPCNSSGITVTATAGNSGVLTCANSSLTLSASSSASGVSYSWTGPNGFTSTQQNPVVSTAGTYTVTGTSSSGSATASVTVTENKAAPDLSASGGSLACGSTSVTLNASSSVSNVTYSWTGPNNFTSTSKNPVVSTAGNYTVTIKNPANGCTASQTVTVTSGAVATDTWTENFSLSDGTTSDNGATAWTTTKPSGSTFAVAGNEFKVSGTGTSDAVWTSGSISISGKTNVKIAVDARSAGVILNDSGSLMDYLRFYYKLNGGSEVMFAEKIGSLNSNSATVTNVSVAGLNGSTLQIVIRARATGSDEFYYFDNVKVTAVDPAVTLTTAVSGPVTCTGNAVITVTPSGTVSSWAWTGPNSFASTTQSPTVTAGGQYNVVATLPNGCTASASVNVTENKTPPDVTATGGALGCLNSITISASSSVSNATYSWSGPNNFSSTSRTPSVNTAGTYTVTVKNPSNGCTATKSVQVTDGNAAPSDFWWEDFSLANGTTSDNGATSWMLSNSGAGTISVQNNEFKVSYNSASEAVWTSGVVDISGKSSVVISASLRSETASTNDAFENDDYMRVFYKLDGGAEMLIYDDAAGIGATTTGTASTVVTSVPLSGSTLQVIIKARNSDPTERYFFDDVKLTGADKSSSITAHAAVTDSLTCTRSSVTLSGSSNTSGATFRWTGPNSFTSSSQNPSVTAPGNYILTATDPVMGCTAADTVTVIRNITPPVVDAGVNGALSCGVTSVTLTANSSTPGVTYSWTGPNGFASSTQNPVVSVAGNYILTVTNPVTGCTAKDTVTVIDNAGTAALWVEDFTLTNGTTSDNGATAWTTQTPSGSTFAVSSNEFKISGQGTTGESVWTSGAINISGKTNLAIAADVRSAVTGGAVMNDSGTYADYLRFYYKLNGGSEVLFAEKKSAINNHSTTYTNVSVTGLATGSSLQVVIRARATGTDEFYYVDNVTVSAAGSGNITATAGVSGPLSCKNTSVTLSGSSNTSGVSYSWTGPNGFSSTQQNPVVTVAGTYTLTVTAGGGCTASNTVTVTQNITKPNLTVTQPGVLTCTTTSVNLVAASTTSGATITWTGFAAGQNPVSVTAPGKYYVTVRDTVNGCTSTDSVTVTQNAAKPDLTVTQPPALTCATTAVNLTAASTTTGATISWTGFTAGQNPVSVTAPGTYTVTAKAPNGCSNTATVTVTQNLAKPNLTVAQPAMLNCANTQVSLSAASTTNGTTFTWSGFAAGQNPVSVSAPGKYYVTATGPNGCTQKDSVTVTQDVSEPMMIVFTPDNLTCTRSSVSLIAAIITSGASLKWEGFAPGENPVTVTAPGKYYITVTGSNGCTQKDSVAVVRDTAKPNLTVIPPATLNCTTTTVNLAAASTTSGTTITWSGFAAGQNPVSVSTPGKYYVTAAGSNGCTRMDSVTVVQNTTKPNLVVTPPAMLTCTNTVVSLTASSSTPNTTITWSGFAAGQNPVSVSTPGKYYVTATSGGCSTTDSVTVTQNITKPNLTVVQPAPLTCTVTSVNLVAASTTSGAVITWTGFAAGQNPVSVSTPGKYYVTATSGGCISKDSVTVTQTITKPNLTVVQPGVLTCATTSVNLTAASTTSGAVINWTGFAAGQNPVSVSTPGKYYVTATSGGCSSKDSVTVTQDTTKPNLTVVQPGVLTCATTAVNLTAASTTSGAVITWTGFAAGQNPVSVSAPGKYYVTATGSNGCSRIDSVTVTQDISKPNLTVVQPGVLTCATTSVNLVAASTTSGAVITWSGFTAGQNPVSVSAPGKYYVTATSSSGCTQKDSVTVTQNINKPNLTVVQPGVLTCATTSVNLTAASTTSGAVITWTGFAAGQNPVSVSAPGKYYVIATGSNGCTQKDSVTVTQDISKPNLTVVQPAVLTCATTAVNLTAASTTSGATITWTGFAAGQNPVSVSAPGKYYVTATSANGCTQKDSITVTQNISKPNLTVVQPGILTCATTSVNLTAGSTTSGATITWTGFAAGQNPVSVSAPGKYYVTATSSNGCTQKDSVTVTQDITKPNLTVVQPGVLTCATTSVNLVAASTTSGATITWTGFAAGQNPVSVSAPGKYYVTATSSSGCTQKDSVTVTQNISKPNLTVVQPGVLTCATTSVNLTAASTTSGATITWTGFAAGQNPVSVSAPGKYYVTATNTNGCTQKDSVTVTQDISKPNLTVVQPGVLTCATTSVNLTAASTTSGATITWSGFAAGQNPVSVSAPGKYYVTATSSSGCTQKDSVTVTQNISKPNLTVVQPGVLTCATTSVNLTAASTTSGATITWTGFAAGQNPVSVSAPGKYYVTTTNTNGCTQKDSVTVTQDNTKPNLTVVQPGILTCATTSVNLVAASTTSGATITWTGFAAGQNPVSVSAPGKYYVTATNTNGCTQKDSVTVTQDNTKPNLTVVQPGVLTCATTSVNLVAASTTSGATITWTGFAAGQNPVSVSAPGKYYATATSANGCTQKDSLTVTQNISKPNLTVVQPGILTCATTSVNLTAASTTSGATITWTGFAAGQNPVNVSAPGKYYVTATSTNGCTQKDSVTVTQDNTKPNLTVVQPGVLTCATTSVNLPAASTTSGATITWTGFAAGQNPVSVSTPGKYYVTATNTNGCTQKDSVTVTQDITKPNLTVVQPGVLTCATTSVNLTAASTTSGATITWTGFAAGQNPVSVSAPGKYYATATSSNGCTQKDSVTVTQDNTKPNLTVVQPGVLTCATTSVNLVAASTTSGATITWTGFAAGQNPVSVSAPGKYYVTATSANGCTQKDSVTVTQNISKPNLTVVQPGVLTCATTSVNLTAASTTSGATITWTGFAAGQNPVSVSAPGKYYATATSSNGCTQKDSVTVTQDNTKPNLTVVQPGVLTCATTSVNLTAASTTSGATITWTGFAAGQNPVSVSAPGKYYATATSSNGCTQKDSVTVTQDNTKPNLTVVQPGILTCATTSVNLTAASTTSGATITWTGFAAGQNPVSASAPGKYYVTATSANGCTQKDSVTVTQDISKPNLTVVQPGILTCATTSVNLTAASTTSGATITWTGFAAGQNPVSVSAPGKYYVTATSSSGCTQKDSVTVTQDITKPNLTVVQPGILTCATTSVNLVAASTTSGATITWTGFTAGQNPVSVSAPGKYYVTATSSTGCTQKDSVTVTQDISKPNLTVVQPAVLTCATTSVNITAASTTSGATITWTGFAAGQNPVSVSTPGKYYVTATNTNGCTQKDSVTVTQDITKPNLTVVQPAVLTCATTQVNLTAASTTSGATITWTGFAAGQNPVSVSAPGKYYVTATNTNGCTQKDSVTVTQDITKPNLTVVQPAVLTCATTQVNLTAASTTSGATITWAGFAAGQNPVSVSAPGKYYVTATNTNGCTQKDSVTVTQDITKPNLTVVQPAVLTCATTQVNLTAASTTSGATITWTGFAAGQNPVSVSAPGKYYVTATNTNGCTQKDSVTVTQDITKPNLTVVQPTVLTCATTTINLTAASTTSGAIITWTGFATGQNPVSVSAPGKYYVTATNTNGCTQKDSVTVTQDITKPNLTVVQPAVLTCATTTVNLTAASTTSGATTTWTGFAAGQNPVSVSAPGKYYATATSTNGCTQKDSVTVTQDITKPNLTVTTPPVLNCITTAVSLTAASTTSGATITWTGFAANQNPVSVTTPGKYYVTVKNNVNGCSSRDSVTVTQDLSAPQGVNATNNGPLTCARTTVTLTGVSSSSNVTYRWTNATNTYNATTAIAFTSAPGTYTLTVTNTATGCTSTKSTVVEQNNTAPAGLATGNDGPLTCIKGSVTLTGSATTPGVTYRWTDGSGFDVPGATAVTTKAGTYTLTVTDPGNGCTATKSTIVAQNKTVPECVINAPATPPDALSFNVLTAKDVNNVAYAWTLSSSDPDWSVITGADASSLVYMSGNAGTTATFNLKVTDKSNGCQNTASLQLSTAAAALVAAPAQSSTMAKSAIVTEEQPLEYKVYPNPFIDRACIAFKAPVSERVEVVIYGVSGNVEKVLFSGQAQAGLTYKLFLEAQGIQPGVHYCVIRANGKIYSSKLILAKW